MSNRIIVAGFVGKVAMLVELEMKARAALATDDTWLQYAPVGDTCPQERKACSSELS